MVGRHLGTEEFSPPCSDIYRVNSSQGYNPVTFFMFTIDSPSF
jgi:hypothetical protein